MIHLFVAFVNRNFSSISIFLTGRRRKRDLQQLSLQYEQEARVLRQRMEQLRLRSGQTKDPEEARRLLRRVRDLEPLQRQSRQLAELTGRYYERGYRRNAQYTL